MPVELYESLYMLDSNKMATDGDSIKTSIVQTIEKHGGTVLVHRPWDESRKLAYPIRKQNITHKKAYYFIVYYKIESSQQQVLDDDCRLNMTDFLLRYMTSHIDPKWADLMVDIAQKEPAAGFAHRGAQDDSPPTEINPGYGGEGMPLGDGGDFGAAPAGPGPGGPGGPRRPRRGDGSEKPE